MTRKIFILITIISGLYLSSCVTPKGTNYMQKPSRSIPSYPDTIGFREYRLQKGDYINIRLYSLNEADLTLYNCNQSTEEASSDNSTARLCLYIVDDEGNIDYPYIGKISVEGKTLRSLKFELEDMFKRDIAKYISVDVRLANRSFSIIGEGGSKRIYMPQDKITIFQALAMAGDLSTYADRSKVKLVRLTEKGTVVKKFDLRTAKIIDSEYYYIQPNDVIYIQHTTAKYVGISHVSNAIGVAISTASIGMIIYRIIYSLKK